MSIYASITRDVIVTGTEGESVPITLRKMSQGDLMERYQRGMERPETLLGFDIARSVVSLKDGDDDITLDEATVAKLDPEVAGAIHAEIRKLNPSIWPDDDPFVPSDRTD